MPIRPRAALITLAATAGTVARAQWTVTHLAPTGSTQSFTMATAKDSQAKSTVVGGVNRAALWNGSASTWVDLHPQAVPYSVAFATSGTQQAGWTFFDNERHACAWGGSSASMVDLNPAGATQSKAVATNGWQQVGWAVVDGETHASLWSTSAVSWVDLNPAGSTHSEATAISGSIQAGWANVGGLPGACVWSGSPDSWVDLHGLLSAEFERSFARAISTDGDSLYIAGHGFNTITNRNEALLWTRPLPCPADLDSDGDFANGLTRDGAVTIGDLLSFLVGFEAGNVLIDLDNGTYTGTPDNAVDINDLLFFLARFEAGC